MLRKSLIVVAVLGCIFGQGQLAAGALLDLTGLDTSAAIPDLNGVISTLTATNDEYYDSEDDDPLVDLDGVVPDFSDLLMGATFLLPEIRDALAYVGAGITDAGVMVTITGGVMDVAGEDLQTSASASTPSDLALQGAGVVVESFGELLATELGPRVLLVGDGIQNVGDALPDLGAISTDVENSMSDVDGRLPGEDTGGADLSSLLPGIISSIENIQTIVSDTVDGLAGLGVSLSDPTDDDPLAEGAVTEEPAVEEIEEDETVVGQTGTAGADVITIADSLFADAFSLDVAFVDETVALATGFEALAGNDRLTNTGDIGANAVAVGGNLTGGISGLKLNIGVSTITAGAVAVDGGEGNDTVDNQGDITSTATAVILSQELTANVGLSSADEPVSATATAVGIEGGAGADTVTNTDSVSAVATAFTGAGSNALSSGVNVVFGNYTGITGYLAETGATGVSGGDGNDTVTNSGGVSAVATSVSSSVSADLQTLGAGKVVSVAEAVTSATALGTGSGEDTVTNTSEGTLTAVATSVAVGQSVSVTKNLTGITSFSPYTWGGGGSAESEATGVALGSGADNLTNDGAITAVATSVTASGAGAVSLSGTAKVDSTSEADAAALGISGGDGNDVITNTGSISAVSTATAATMEFAFSGEGGTAIMNFLQKVIHKGGAFSSAESLGIGTDGIATETDSDYEFSLEDGEVALSAYANQTTESGDDRLTNTAGITSVATAVSGSGAVAVTLKNAAKSDSRSIADARAVALDTGSGDDVVTNSGAISAVSTAAAGAITVNISGAKTAEANTEAVATAEAIGISGDGESADASMLADLTLSDEGYYSHVAYSNLAATGDDTITNTGDVTAVATAVSGSAAISVSSSSDAVGKIKNDVNAVTAKSVADASAVGIDAGAGDDTVINNGDITAVSTSVAGAIALSLSVNADSSTTKDWIKQAFLGGGAIASADAVGVRTDSVYSSFDTAATLVVNENVLSETIYAYKTASGGNDILTNTGNISAVATAVTASGSVSVSEEGAVKADAVSSAAASAMGLDTGMGNDTVENSGEITAVATAVAASLEISSSNSTADSSRSAVTRALVDYGASAESNATGIAGDSGFASHRVDETATLTEEALTVSVSVEKAVSSGDDTISNTGAVTAVSTAVSGAGSGAVSINKAAKAHSNSTASAISMGIDAGAGNDTVTNSGDVTAVSTAVANSLSVGYSEADDGEITANATAEAVATGIRGDGDLTGGSFSTEVVLTNDALDIGTDISVTSGTGSDTIDNSGQVTAVATAVSGAAAIAGSSSGDKTTAVIHKANIAEANSTAVASATGIDAGSGDDVVINSGEVTAVSTAVAGALELSISSSKDSSTTKNWLMQSIMGGGASANATAIGIRGDGDSSATTVSGDVHVDEETILVTGSFAHTAATGVDEITNTGDVTAVATAVSGALSASISTSGAVKSDAVSNASAFSVGVEAGGGDDTVINSGAITSVATANAASLEVTATESGVSDSTRNFLTKRIVDYGAAAEAEAVGVKGDGAAASYRGETAIMVTAGTVGVTALLEKTVSTGADAITNDGSITAVATAASETESIAVSIENAASASTVSKASSLAMGIDAGAGNDTVENSGKTTAVSTAVALGLGVTVSESKDSSSSATAKADATAVGISGDGDGSNLYLKSALAVTTKALHGGATLQVTRATGDDTINNTGTVTSVATAVSGAGSMGVSISGGAVANVDSISAADAMGIDAGAGKDTVTNSGDLTAVATAVSSALGVSVAGGGSTSDLYGYFMGGTNATATATGISISGDGEGSDFSTLTTVDIDFTQTDVAVSNE
ncbi:MAG: hypothetical protein JEZ12_21520 [Desulfobacterium sp.]|nr:hypothetical protein [Desulfobacterium sp.]